MGGQLNEGLSRPDREPAMFTTNNDRDESEDVAADARRNGTVLAETMPLKPLIDETCRPYLDSYAGSYHLLPTHLLSLVPFNFYVLMYANYLLFTHVLMAIVTYTSFLDHVADVL